MENVAAWARRILDQPGRYVIVDTETTGLGRRDQVIQIGVISLDGEVLMNQRIKPTVRIDPNATLIHGMTAYDLMEEPNFLMIEPMFRNVVQYRTMLMYNAAFDCRLLDQTYKAYWRRPPRWDAKCIMEKHTRWAGRITKLGGNHDAVGDCHAALAVIKRMAKYHGQTTTLQ